MERPVTPIQSSNSPHCEATTRKKARFFHAVDCKPKGTCLADVYATENVPKRTAYLWLRQRRIYGSRIAEMSSRCKQLVAVNGKGIKSSLWWLIHVCNSNFNFPR